MTDWLYNGLIEWLAEQVQGMLGGLVSLLTGTFFTSPDVTVFPQVQTVVARSIVVVNAAFVLAIIAAGAIAMTHAPSRSGTRLRTCCRGWCSPWSSPTSASTC